MTAIRASKWLLSEVRRSEHCPRMQASILRSYLWSQLFGEPAPRWNGLDFILWTIGEGRLGSGRNYLTVCFAVICREHSNLCEATYL